MTREQGKASLQVAPPVGVDSLAPALVADRAGIADQGVDGCLIVASQHGGAYLVRIALRAVALGAETVGDAARFQDGKRLFGKLHRVGAHLAHANAEAVSLQVAEPQLVAMQGGGKYGEPGD